MLVAFCLTLFLNPFVLAQNIGSNNKIYFIRKISIHEPNKSLTQNLMEEDALSKVNIFIDTSLICKLHKQKYLVHDVQVGKHGFSAQSSGKKQESILRKYLLT
jgi:hypothetical protein